MLLESARRASARAVNALMTATYWEIGRRVVEAEQGGKRRADYGERLVERLAADLTKRFGRGFGTRNLFQMRAFYLAYPATVQTPPARFLPERREILQTPSAEFADLSVIAGRFPLPWSHYVCLLSVEKLEARKFYEEEALRGGWSVRQLDRQVGSLFYERTLLSRNKAAMLRKGEVALARDVMTPEEEIKDPYILEFLDLKDEYSESDLEAALIQRLESFLLELGGDFAFIGRQRRLRVGDQWFRIDLLFFHRRLRCLVVIDLKHGKFTHADAGQMHLYLNYAREHWIREGENPPVGIILCTRKDATVARYALEGLPNRVVAAEYRTTLPNETTLAEEMTRTRRLLEARRFRVVVKPARKPRKT
jgi:predicted nuclease of restriction endonuclease-like (RecB) superfamily